MSLHQSLSLHHWLMVYLTNDSHHTALFIIRSWRVYPATAITQPPLPSLPTPLPCPASVLCRCVVCLALPWASTWTTWTWPKSTTLRPPSSSAPAPPHYRYHPPSPAPQLPVVVSLVGLVPTGEVSRVRTCLVLQAPIMCHARSLLSAPHLPFTPCPRRLLAPGHPEVRPDHGGRAHVSGGGGPSGTLPRGLRPPRHQRTEHQEVHTKIRALVLYATWESARGRLSPVHSVCATIYHPTYAAVSLWPGVSG